MRVGRPVVVLCRLRVGRRRREVLGGGRRRSAGVVVRGARRRRQHHRRAEAGSAVQRRVRLPRTTTAHCMLTTALFHQPITRRLPALRASTGP